MDAADWREYRRRNADRLREYNRARRQQPKLRAQRHVQEQRRRNRRRVEESPIPALHVGHPWFERARRLVPDAPAMTQLMSTAEALVADARSEAVLAMAERRDPVRAVRAFIRREGAWMSATECIDAGR